MTDYNHVHPTRLDCFLLTNHQRMLACSEDIWVPHPSAEKLINQMYLMMQMKNKINAPSMVVIGPGGSGKTSHIDELKRRNQSAQEKMVFVTMHQSPNGYSLKELILQEIGIKTSRRARQADNISTELQYLIKSQNIRAIVIDEIHDALTLTEFQQRINLSLLKNLSGSSYGLCVFAFGIPDAARVLRRDPQLARRYAVRSLQQWGNDGEFRSFVASYIHRLPLKNPTNFKDQRLFLKIMEKGQGLTDNIVKILQAAAMTAVLDGSEHIGHHHLDNIDCIMEDLCLTLRDVDELERTLVEA
ncbi:MULTISPECIES: TniB family NTP-binding protein [unclassified Pseudomonas]|uniref:TniB family NTP-binding protein n=1 Tax=unclassified Pseudomonas TaxID=196821 RepID=UPI001E167553|nr:MULTISPECIES: TniB family NTP-binding protein [unclassified Pseudomonas]MBP2271329.1 AAA+ superfamily predicted ATPase [Pseudomonas sp. BP6]MBP2289700.1 AAA+ superfamily predicted ATPase [Pseudomonas sp. BP7]